MTAAALQAARRRRRSRGAQADLFTGARAGDAPVPQQAATGQAEPSGGIEAAGAGPIATLGQRLTRTWQMIATAGLADCPLCGAEMRRPETGHAGICDGCGSRLA